VVRFSTEFGKIHRLIKTIIAERREEDWWSISRVVKTLAIFSNITNRLSQFHSILPSGDPRNKGISDTKSTSFFSHAF
jgi:hypothetical protein